MHYRITHKTHYQYAQAVNHCHNLAYMLPRDTAQQRCVFSSLVISPDPCSAQERFDSYGNRAYDFSILKPHNTLSIVATSEVEIDPCSFDQSREVPGSCAEVMERLFRSTSKQTIAASDFLSESPLVPFVEAIADYARPIFTPEKNFLDAVRELNQKIYAEFEYDPEFTEISTPLSEVFEHRRGVCQDFTQLAIGCLRSMGYRARYVSGYIATQASSSGSTLVGSHASHAWLSVYIPDEGWFDFDPTNNQMSGRQHIVTAWGRDYSDVAPLKGTIFGGGDSHTLEVEVLVELV